MSGHVEARTAGEYFSRLADEYDERIVRCVPRYEEMLDQLLDVIPAERAGGRVLEMGTGTGGLTSRYLERYPSAELVGIDASYEMLATARTRCARDHVGSVAPRLIRSEFEELALAPMRFDVVTSSISLHHIADKKPVYERVFDLLRPGGVFVFADQCAGADERLHHRNWSLWLAFLDEKGASQKEIDSWLEHAARHDHYEPVATHFQYLEECGFESVDCVWRHLIWGIISAQRPAAV